jgi:hypothetical protein
VLLSFRLYSAIIYCLDGLGKILINDASHPPAPSPEGESPHPPAPSPEGEGECFTPPPPSDSPPPVCYTAA